MGDNVFNIFGSSITEQAPRKLVGINFGENANVGKSALMSKGATTASINKNISTPKHTDLKKRTFLQNEGASIQVFCPKSYDTKKNTSQSAAKSNMQVYEDIFNNINHAESDMISIEYNRKPAFYDDTSDDEFAFSDKQLDDVILGLPKHNQIRMPEFEPVMMDQPKEQDICDDSLIEPTMDDQDMNIDEFVILE